MKIRAHNKQGFTFIEVMVALLILVLTMIAAVNVTSGSVRATRDSKEITTATWLLQNIMVQLETKLETEGFDKGCEDKSEARFEPPYERFTWTTYCTQIDFQLSETAAQLAATKESDEGVSQTTENMITKMVLTMASDYLSKATRELHAEVSWQERGVKRAVNLTTHTARYDLQIQIPAAPSLGGS